MVAQYIPLEACELIGTMVESLFFGLFIVLFILAMYVLLGKRRENQGSVNKIMFFVAISQLVLCSIHWVNMVARQYKAFVPDRDKPGGPAASLDDLRSAGYILKNILYDLQIMMGDGLLAWRLTVVWSVWVAIPAFVLFLGHATMGIMIMYKIFTLPANESLLDETAAHFITSAFVLTLCNNLYCSCMIAIRIYHINSATKQRHSALFRVIQIVIESAAIYTAFTFMAFLVYVLGSNLYFGFVGPASTIIGIAFCLIIVRVGLRGEFIETTHASSTMGRRYMGTKESAGRGMASEQPVELTVHISKQVDHDSGFEGKGSFDGDHTKKYASPV